MNSGAVAHLEQPIGGGVGAGVCAGRGIGSVCVVSGDGIGVERPGGGVSGRGGGLTGSFGFS